MDDTIEIDFRKIIRILLKCWWQIIAFAAILAVLAFVVTSLMPISYQATALVAITKPQYNLNFDPKILTVYSTEPASNAYLDLALSDDVLKQVFDKWAERPETINDPDDLRENVVQISMGQDPSILKLTVRTQNAAQSASLANHWASTLIEKSNTIYFGSEQQLEFLEEQLVGAQGKLESAEKELLDFQSQNKLATLTNKLNSALFAQSEQLALQRNIMYLIQSTQGLRSQLIANQGSNPTTADQLSALLLQLQLFNTQVNTNLSSEETQISSDVKSIPLQIQFNDPSALGSMSTQDQIRFLDSLLESIEERYAQGDESLEALEPQILGLQSSVQEYQTEFDRLQRTRDIAEQTYTTLAKKVDEVRITDQDPTDRLQLASSALPPSDPLPRNRLRNTILAGGVGGVLAAALVLLWEWWREKTPPEAA